MRNSGRRGKGLYLNAIMALFFLFFAKRASHFHFALGPTHYVANSGGDVPGWPCACSPFARFPVSSHSSGLQSQETTYRQVSIDTCSEESRMFQVMVGLLIHQQRRNFRGYTRAHVGGIWGPSVNSFMLVNF